MNSLGNSASRPLQPPHLETVNCHCAGMGGCSTPAEHSGCQAKSWTFPQEWELPFGPQGIDVVAPLQPVQVWPGTHMPCNTHPEKLN